MKEWIYCLNCNKLFSPNKCGKFSCGSTYCLKCYYKLERKRNTIAELT